MVDSAARRSRGSWNQPSSTWLRAGPLAIVRGPTPALIFDLDGTLVDTVYAHVFAWQRVLSEHGMAIDGWRIHRRIGMSGGLFTRAVGRELGHELDEDVARSVQDRHGRLFGELL